MAATTRRTRKRTERGVAAPASTLGFPAWLAPAIYALVTVVLFREFIVSRDMLFGTDTLALGYFARDFYREFVRTIGEFPLWNPLIFGGLPFVDGMHGDIFYPTTLLLFLQDTHRALGWKLVLHVFLAGWFTFIWLRGLELERPAAFFGGLVYMLGAHLVSLVYPGHDGKMFVAALTPLLFWLTERAVRNRGYPDFAFLALGVAGLLYTAHMQLAYFAVWGFSLYFLFRVARVWRAERAPRAVARLVGLFALAGLLGAGAASVQLVPPLRYLQEWSHRVDRTLEADAEDGYAYSTSWSLHPEEALALVVPEFVGSNIDTRDGRVDTYWGRNAFKLNHEYAGFLPLLLLPLLFFRRRDPRDLFFLGLAALALLYALGDTTPAFRLFYHLVPGVSLFRAPSSIAFLFAFAVATLGAFGLVRFLDWASRDDDSRTARRYLWGATAGFGVLALLASAGIFTDLWQAVFYRDIAPDRVAALERNLPNIRAGFWIAFGLAALAAAAWEAHARAVIGRNVALAAIALLAVFDLWRVDRPFILTVDPAPYVAADDAVRYLQTLRDQGEVFRVFDVGGYPMNHLALHGLEELAGHHGNEIGRYRELIGGEYPQNIAVSELRLLDLANVAYLVSPQPLDVPGFRETYRGARSLVYRNENVLPRAFLVGSVEVAADEAAVERLLSREFDFRTTALVAEPLPAGIAPEPEPQGRVEWTEPGVNRYALRAVSDRPALLVVTDNYYDAWTAEVNGEPAPILRVNHTFRAVPVPAGASEVRFAYRSGWLRATAWTSAGLLLLLLGVGIGGRVRGGAGKGGGST